MHQKYSISNFVSVRDKVADVFFTCRFLVLLFCLAKLLILIIGISLIYLNVYT